VATRNCEMKSRRCVMGYFRVRNEGADGWANQVGKWTGSSAIQVQFNN